MGLQKGYKRRLRNSLIYPRFQLGLLAVQAGAIGAIFFAVWFENHAAFERMNKMGAAAGIPPESAYFDFMGDQSHNLFVHTSVAFGVALLISSAITLYLSFRLAGPIYRLRKYMREVEENGGVEGLEPLRFRKGAFYSDLPEIVNRALKKVKFPKGNS